MVHTLTLNPAIDVLLFLDEFKKNVTNRLTSSDKSIGGKGTHVSINLASLGMTNTAFGFAHGESGKQIIDMLEKYPICVEFLYKEENNSRTNYLLIEDNGDCCCLSSPGVPLSHEDIDHLIETLRDKIHDGDTLVLSGDASNCPDASTYNYILDKLQDKKLKIYLDASGTTLKECLLASPFLIKPNQDELSQICGRELTTESEIIDAIRSLEPYQIPIIAVSLGGDGSIVKTPDGLYRVYPPAISVQNTIGCGDCFLSGIIYGLEKGYDITETLRLATAISAATAESHYSVGFDLERAKELKENVKIINL